MPALQKAGISLIYIYRFYERGEGRYSRPVTLVIIAKRAGLSRSEHFG